MCIDDLESFRSAFSPNLRFRFIQFGGIFVSSYSVLVRKIILVLVLSSRVRKCNQFRSHPHWTDVH